jgi:hypothetical protein
MIMSIFNTIFGAAPKTNAPPVNPAPGSTTQGDPNLGTQNSIVTAPNGVVPKQPEAPASPLAEFADIWKNVPNPADANKGVFEGVDPQKLMDAAGKVDFSKIISNEELASINAGGDKAGAAYITSLNKVAQTVYGQSAVATTKIVEQALAKQAASFQEQLPALIRKHAVSDSLRTENPLLANPAIAPLASALEAQLQLKNPNATVAEIKAKVNEYFDVLSTQFAAPKEAAKVKATAAAKGEVDWDKYMSM